MTLYRLAVWLAPASLFAQFGGMSSRPPLNFGNSDGNPNFTIRPFIGIQGQYTQGQNDRNGQLTDYSGYGYGAHAGVVGARSWENMALSLNYNVLYRKYTSLRGSSPARFAQNGNVNYQVQFPLKHNMQAYGALRAGIFDGAGGGFGGFGGLGGFAGAFMGNTLLDPNAENVPYGDFIDTLTYFGSAMTGVIYQPAFRWTMSASGGASIVRRDFAGLPGLNSYTARGDVGYAISQRQTISLNYFYMRYFLTGGFDNGDVNGVTLGYSNQVTRRWNLSVMAGIARLEPQRIQRVRLNPVIAAILGQSSGLEVTHGIYYFGIGSAALSRAFENGSFSMIYSRSVRPGHDTYLTSRRDSAGASYIYSGLEKISFRFYGGYMRISSFTQQLPPGESYGASAGLTYRLMQGLNLSGGYGIRRMEGGSDYKRTVRFATVALTFSPGTVPISFW